MPEINKYPAALKASLGNNAKTVIPTGSELVNIIGDIAGIVPLTMKQSEILK